jgi:hypothetical protein
MSLVIIILLSSFFFIADYRNKINQATISSKQLRLLDAIDLFRSADERLTKLLAENKPVAWLHLAQIYANNNADVAYQLGKYYLQEKQMLPAELWLKEAVRQQHQLARIVLAKQYLDNKLYRDAKSLLLPVIKHEQALILLSEIALQLGDSEFFMQYQATLAVLANTEFYQELVSFSIFEPKTTKTTSQCIVDVQLFATNLTGLRHGKQLIAQFRQHKLSNYICLRMPKYIPQKNISCQTDPQEKISCNADVWADRTDILSRYVGLIVEQGGANVDNGIMYIDQQDNLDVLVHELNHFIGYIDEYPLPSQHQKCQQMQEAPFSHNVVTLADLYYGERSEIRKKILAQLPWASLIKDSTPIMSKRGQGWLLQTPKIYHDRVGLFLARSCDKNELVQAYKPLPQRTQLEYFELNFPAMYFDILKIAPRQYLMPSYHFNVSRDLAAQGKYTKAKEILQATIFD